MGSFKIELKGLRFMSRIGVSEQERKVGNEFVVDVAYSFPTCGFIRENLGSTISYADIYSIVRDEMRREWLLLESVAVSISDRIQSKFPQISNIEVSVTKTSVPLDGMSGAASVTLVS